MRKMVVIILVVVLVLAMNIPAFASPIVHQEYNYLHESCDYVESNSNYEAMQIDHHTCEYVGNSCRVCRVVSGAPEPCGCKVYYYKCCCGATLYISEYFCSKHNNDV